MTGPGDEMLQVIAMEYPLDEIHRVTCERIILLVHSPICLYGKAHVIAAVVCRHFSSKARLSLQEKTRHI